MIVDPVAHLHRTGLFRSTGSGLRFRWPDVYRSRICSFQVFATTSKWTSAGGGLRSSRLDVAIRRHLPFPGKRKKQTLRQKKRKKMSKNGWMQIRGATRLVLVPQPNSKQKSQAAQWFRARPRDIEVVGSNPAGCWAFFFSSPILSVVCP